MIESQFPRCSIILSGLVFADKGYISKKLIDLLPKDNIKLIITIRKNMKPRLISHFEKVLLRKRYIIETINDQFKNISDLEHSRYRSLTNDMVNIIASLVAYSYQPKKPSIKINNMDLVVI